MTSEPAPTIDQAAYTYDLFISYAEADRTWVDGYLLDALDQIGVRWHSEDSFALGVPRLVEFERAIQQSKRTLLVLSPAYLVDTFGQFVDVLVNSYGIETATWPVVPLLLQPMELPPRLSQLTRLDATEEERWPLMLERLCEQLQRPPPAPAPLPPCPYPGMAPFREADSDRFFGREQEVRDLLDRLRLHPFIAVIGASGSGKSSLVSAGLVPALRKSRLFGPGAWLFRTFRPGAAPLQALAEALAPRDAGLAAAPDAPAASAADPPQAELPSVSALLASELDARRLLLVVDQFEETFTVGGADATAFQEALLGLSQAPGCYVALTVRADFYAELMGSPLWPSIQAHRSEVAPMTDQGLRRAIMQPAENAGVYIETALVERLLADAAGEPGVLPLVQEALVLLWERLERRYLPMRAYEALVLTRSAYGADETTHTTGLQVAIARRADATLADLAPEQQAIARRIFLRLVQFGEGRADTRRQQSLAELHNAGDDPYLFEQTLQHLAGSRLLTLSGDENKAQRTQNKESGFTKEQRTTDNGQRTTRRVDIAHEALIRGWPTLQGWLDERRDVEQTRRRLEGKAAEWVRLGSGDGGLLDEVELAEAERWLESPDASDIGFDQTLPELVVWSRAAIERAQSEKEAAREHELAQARALAEEQQRRADSERQRAEEQSRAAVRLRRRAWLLAGLGVMAVALAVVGVYLGVVATRARNDAQSLALSAQAENALGLDVQTGLSLALVGVEKARTLDSETAVRDALLYTYKWRALTAEGQPVHALTWSPDGTRLASASTKGEIRIWDAQTGAPLAILAGHTDDVRSLAWSPDSTRLASASYDKTIRIWYGAGLDPPQIGQTTVLTGHTEAVFGVSWSPDGKLLASASRDGTVRLWDVAAGRGVAVLNPDSGDINDVDWSPDGTRLAFATDVGTLQIWRINDLMTLSARSDATPKPVLLVGHHSFALSVAWSPDGERLASASADGTIRVWDPAGGPSIDTLVGHKSWVESADWSPDGTRLVSASDDTTVRIWEVATSESLVVLTGHQNYVYDARWNKAGTTLATASADTSIRLWDLAHVSTTVFSGHQGEVKGLAWNPKGRWLASGGDDGLVQISDTTAAESPTVIATRIKAITDVAWSSDGAQLAFIDDGGTVGLWSTGIVKIFKAHDSKGWRLAWSPDGRSLATVARTGEIKLWDSRTFQSLGAFDGGGVRAIAWSPDGASLATGAVDGAVKIWDARTLRNTQTFSGHTDLVWAVAWSPDGRMLASASGDKTARVWAIGDSAHPERAVFAQHKLAVNAVAWSPDGQTLATAADDATVRLWSVEQQKCIALLNGPQKAFLNLAWQPGGRQLAASAADGTTWVFYTRFDDILAIARQQPLRQFTPEELSHYLGEN